MSPQSRRSFLQSTTALLGAAAFAAPFESFAARLRAAERALTVHRGHGFFVSRNGVELNLLIGLGAIGVAFTGPGAYSVDRALGLSWSPSWGLVAVGLGLAGGGLQLAGRLLGRRKTAPELATR